MLRYNLLLRLLSPVLLIYTAWLALRAGGWRYWRERLGRHDDEPVDLWLHAASVGEVNAARPLVHALRRRVPDLRVLVTTNTATGAQLAGKLGASVAHAYLPLDFKGAVHRFVRRRRPRCALIMETELWPNLYRACQDADIALLIVNGRLSPKSTGAGPWRRKLYREALTGVPVLARSAEDGERYRALGAGDVQVIGNIKFAAPVGRPNAAGPSLGAARPYVLAASTHDDEELQLVRMWQQCPWHGDYLLVIAPRHPQRGPDILRQLAPLTERIAVRSRGEQAGPDTELFLLDTVGELLDYMAGAELVFVGGSLIPRGGHNILEPASLGKPVVFGPHMDNFRDEAALFLQAEAAVQVNSVVELGALLDQLQRDPQRRAALGERARALMAEHGEVAERYVEAIVRHCPTLQARA